MLDPDQDAKEDSDDFNERLNTTELQFDDALREEGRLEASTDDPREEMANSHFPSYTSASQESNSRLQNLNTPTLTCDLCRRKGRRCNGWEPCNQCRKSRDSNAHLIASDNFRANSSIGCTYEDVPLIREESEEGREDDRNDGHVPSSTPVLSSRESHGESRRGSLTTTIHRSDISEGTLTYFGIPYVHAQVSAIA